MSNNMGNRTSVGAARGHGFGARYEACGMVIPQRCPICGESKRGGVSHPKCSRIMQRRYAESLEVK